jgi:hypothetical protein
MPIEQIFIAAQMVNLHRFFLRLLPSGVQGKQIAAKISTHITQAQLLSNSDIDAMGEWLDRSDELIALAQKAKGGMA